LHAKVRGGRNCYFTYNRLMAEKSVWILARNSSAGFLRLKGECSGVPKPLKEPISHRLGKAVLRIQKEMDQK
jgi:hypothetical protein